MGSTVSTPEGAAMAGKNKLKLKGQVERANDNKGTSGVPVPKDLGALGLPNEKLQVKYTDLLDALMQVDPTQLIHRKLFSPYNPEVLVTRKGLSIFDKMKRDEQVKAALKFKKFAMLSSGWEIQAPGNQPDDWEPLRFVKAQLTQVQGGFQKAMKKIMLSMDYGYSVTEKVFKEIEEGDWKGKVGLSKLISIKPHYIDFVVDVHGQLLALLQRNVAVSEAKSKSNVRERDPLYPPGKFVVHTFDQEFENAYGNSDLIAAYRPWWTKDNAYKWLAIYLERYGMAPLVAMYNRSVYQGGQVEQLKQLLKNIQNATFGVIPRLSKEDIEIWSEQISSGSKDIFIPSIDKFDRDIARSLLVPGLVGMTADEGVGSLARSATHFDAFLLVLSDGQDDYAENAINAQLIQPLCDLNYQGLDEYPIFKFMPFKDEKRIELFRLWLELVKEKVVGRIKDDETHIRRSLSMPENEKPVIEPLPEDAKLEADVKAKKEAAKRPAVPPAKKKFSEDFPGDDDLEDEEEEEYAEHAGEVILAEEQSEEELTFAKANGCVWRTINGRKVCIVPKGSMDDRVSRAMRTYKPATQEKQAIADREEQRVAMALKGRRTDDNDPVDVIVKIGGRTHGVEVKTFVDNSNNKVTVHPESLRRKMGWERKNNGVLHTVVVDKRNATAPGLYSGHDLYYRRGTGSFRLGTMTRVRSIQHLKDLLITKEMFTEEDHAAH
jgi:phage gp29-like protein